MRPSQYSALLCITFSVLLLTTPASVVARGTVDEPVIPLLTETDKGSADNPDELDPEAATGRGDHALVQSTHDMVSAANTLASQAGARMLADGGSAVDAIIAMQFVLNLVEPQSSGLGGGGFVVNFDAETAQVQAWDGRETAPAAARADRFLKEGEALSFRDAVNNGRAVGVPGLLRMLHDLHSQHGILPWAELAAPAIKLAESGFPVSDRLHQLLADSSALRDQPEAAAYFYDPSGDPWPVGHVLTNPEFAQTLRLIAEQGPKPFYEGELATAMVAAVAEHPKPGDLSHADLAGYQASQRDPLCMPYRTYQVCGMPPPSSGTLAVLQMLGILSHTPIDSLEPNELMSVHYFAEAGRLAYADRNRYVADPDFVDVPLEELLDAQYLQDRAGLIRDDESMGKARAGEPDGANARPGTDGTAEQPSTTHMVATDVMGNVVSMTSTIESAFGSKIFVNGYLLNNELTDFSLTGTDEQGRPVSNRVEAGKRPRSSMAPMIVLQDGRPVVALGSPGGPAIINYVAKTLLGVLDWGMDIQKAIDLPHRGSHNSATTYLEKGTSLAKLQDDLEDLGHEVELKDFPSGLHGLVMTPDGIQGGADPRREGRAVGH